MSIRTRLLLVVLSVLAIGLVLFAGVSIVAIDRSLRLSLDSTVQTTAQAVAAAVDVHEGEPDPDKGDLAQIAHIRASVHATILDAKGRRIDGEVPPVVPAAHAPASMSDLGTGEALTRVAIEPIVRDDKIAGHVIAWRNDDWIEGLDRSAIVISALVGLALLGVAALVVGRAAGTIIAPLERMASTAERIEGHDLSLRLHVAGRDELARLGSSFDRMLDRLQRAFARERQFTADASHELRAPLAVLRAEAELALRRERSGDEYRAALSGIVRESDRLHALVDDLLAAARAEIDATQRRTVDLRMLANDVAERAGPAARLKSIEIDARGPQVFAEIEAVGIERALLAIVHNAVTFAPERGHITIATEAGGSGAAIAVLDDGPGFTAEALAHASERFWRGNDARPRGGTGLGLAIAHALAAANGGTLELSNRPGGGAAVTLRFTSSSSHDRIV